MKHFALIGVAGYVAPRHLKAIRDIGGDLIAVLDPHDSVGILDFYFPEAEFFTDAPSFERFLAGRNLDYVSICSPNWLHRTHIEMALRLNATAICEKPLVVRPCDLVDLLDAPINTIMQLRLHPDLIALRHRLTPGQHEVDLTYVAPRGRWYHASWKGDPSKSGGLIANIGIHMFDLLLWLFGDVQRNVVHERSKTQASGKLDLERARVRWSLSIEPDEPKRAIIVDGEEIEFSGEGLHSKSYHHILAGEGFTPHDALPAIQLVSAIRDAQVRL
jgi:UDP-N-acetyl-2-amino-2-deoxyglucuronate dehydrogenase